MTESEPRQESGAPTSAHGYVPEPMRLAGVALPIDLQPLLERLAENAHDQWAEQRMGEGWVYGPQRDDMRRTHPCLLRYEDLPETEKAYDRLMVEGTLKAIVHLGYRIVPSTQPREARGASGHDLEIS